MSLLQPAPEVFNLFDDVCLLSEGRIVFMGPKEEVPPIVPRLAITHLQPHFCPCNASCIKLHVACTKAFVPLVPACPWFLTISYVSVCLPLVANAMRGRWPGQATMHRFSVCHSEKSPCHAGAAVLRVHGLPAAAAQGHRRLSAGKFLAAFFQPCSSQLCLSVAPTCSRRNHHHPVGLPGHDV